MLEYILSWKCRHVMHEAKFNGGRWKANSHQESNPTVLGWANRFLPLNYDHQTITSLTILLCLHKWYWTLQSHAYVTARSAPNKVLIWHILSGCHVKQLKNSVPPVQYRLQGLVIGWQLQLNSWVIVVQARNTGFWFPLTSSFSLPSSLATLQVCSIDM